MDRETCLTPVRSHQGISSRFGCPNSFSGPLPHNTISTPQCDHCHLSFTASPFPTTNPGKPGLGSTRWHWVCSALVSPCLILRVFSSTLLPGFIGPDSSVLPVNLPPSVPYLALGSPRQVGFLSSEATPMTGQVGLPWVRRTTSLYPVRLHVRSVLRISGLA